MESWSVGKVIETLRLKKEITQADLAELAGISPSVLSKMENDKSPVPDHVLARLCIPLEVPASAVVAMSTRQRFKELDKVEAEVRAQLGLPVPKPDLSTARVSFSDLVALIDARMASERAWLVGLARAVNQPSDTDALIASLPAGVREALARMSGDTGDIGDTKKKRRVSKPRKKKAQAGKGGQ